MTAESIDVYDEAGSWRGVKDRATAHADGDWHRVFHCWVVADRGPSGTVVLQRRATTKRTFPGLLDASATGHLAAGETPEQGIRELEEELGIEVDESALVPLGVRRVVDRTPEGLNRELAHVFLLRDDRPLADYRPRPEELAGVADVPIGALLDLLGGRAEEISVLERPWRHGRAVPRPVTRADLVPALDGYWLVATVMAQRLLEGRWPLAV